MNNLNPIQEQWLQAALVVMVCVSALAVGPGCVSEDDSSVGTGSAGGNPLVIGFGARPSPSLPNLDVTSEVHILTVEIDPYIVDTRGIGSCAGELQEPIVLNFNSQDGEVLVLPIPCRVLIKPSPQSPLMRIVAALEEKGIIIDYDFAEGLFINIDKPERIADELKKTLPEQWDPEDFTSEDLRLWQSIYIIFDVDAFQVELGLASLLEVFRPSDPNNPEHVISVDGMDTDARKALRQALVSAVRIYLDPTPGDGELAVADQISDNIVAKIELNE
ncbi:MAG: hypothetical protein AAFS10_22790 [Myxococcota bacterium]